jgi:dTDP-4-dehydrorhamnose 3,5-epimerase-like enzyme
MKFLEHIQLLSFKDLGDNKASLSVYSSPEQVPFLIKRVFVINTTEEVSRGFHAHKECNQLLVCLQGKIIVTVDDGRQRKEFELTKSTEGLFIPATVWAEQSYDSQTILMVLTDQPYDEKDYIRDYQEFLKFRKD